MESVRHAADARYIDCVVVTTIVGRIGSLCAKCADAACGCVCFNGIVKGRIMGDDDDVLLARIAKKVRAEAGVPVLFDACALTQFAFFAADRNQRNDSADQAMTDEPSPFPFTT